MTGRVRRASARVWSAPMASLLLGLLGDSDVLAGLDRIGPVGFYELWIVRIQSQDRDAI
jgi:hypothetical protein